MLCVFPFFYISLTYQVSFPLPTYSQNCEQRRKMTEQWFKKPKPLDGSGGFLIIKKIVI